VRCLAPRVVALSALLAMTLGSVACFNVDLSEPVTDCESLSVAMAQIDVDASGKGTATVLIVPRDVTLRNLVCVAERLQRENPGWTEVRVAIFDTPDVADHYLFDWQSYDVHINDAPDPGIRWEELRRALYVVSQSARTRYLKLRLFGVDGDGRYETRIDLPAVDPIRCRFEVNRRCLLVAASPRLPLMRGITGSVTVIAEAQRDGTFSKIRAIKTVAKPADAAKLLAAVATRDLQTWRLDAAASQDLLSVHYRFTDGVIKPFIEMSSPTSATVFVRTW